MYIHMLLQVISFRVCPLIDDSEVLCYMQCNCVDC